MATASLSPTEDGFVSRWASSQGACATDNTARNNTSVSMVFGGYGEVGYHEQSRSYVEWDISSLAGKTLIANPKFKYHGQGTLATSEEINPLTEGAPSALSDVNLYNAIGSGTAYVDPFTLVVGATQEVDLGATARADLQAAMDASQSWFAIGLQAPDDECPGSGVGNVTSLIYSEDKTGPSADPPPTLYVEYLVVAPQAVADGRIIGPAIIRKS